MTKNKQTCFEKQNKGKGNKTLEPRDQHTGPYKVNKGTVAKLSIVEHHEGCLVVRRVGSMDLTSFKLRFELDFRTRSLGSDG